MGWENVRTWLLAAVATLAILSALYLARPAPTHADGPIYVSGIISSPTTWTASGSPYIVTGNILVTRTVTLTVEPGVTVKFDGPYYLRVDGALKAIGTPSQPITFTSNKASPDRGDWESILLSDGSVSASYGGLGNYVDGSTIQYAMAEYGSGRGTIQAEGDAAPFIANTTVRRGAGFGIHVLRGPARIVSNTLEDNLGTEGAIHVAGPSRVLSNTVRNNPKGGMLAFGGALVAYNTVVSNSGAAGILVRAGSATIFANMVSGNSGAGIAVQNGSASIVSNTITGNWASGIAVSWSARAKIEDNFIGGNRAGDGGGIYVQMNASARISGNAIRENTASRFGGGVFGYNLDEVPFNDVRGNVSVGGGGLFLPGDAGPISGNNFEGNTPSALHNYGRSQISASHNYWGTTDTSAIDAAIWDFYDDFDKGVVSYTPILTQPISLPPRKAFVPLVVRESAGGW